MSTLTPPVTARRGLPRTVDLHAVSVWVMSAGLVLYLAFQGGGYAIADYGRAGIVVWWIALLSVASGVLPLAGTRGRAALTALIAFGAFDAWTALGITWSISVGRGFQDLALVTTYLGILVLATMIHGGRPGAPRRTVGAVVVAIVVVDCAALSSRLWPGFLPVDGLAHQPQSAGRLAWPIGYWNALGCSAVLALPLLLAIATTARGRWTRSLAAGALPIVVLCGALTQSRGAAVGAVIAVAVWIGASSQRMSKLATLATTGVGSTVLIAIAFGDRAVRLGLTGGVAERNEAHQLMLAIVCVAIAVGLLQQAIEALGRRLAGSRVPRAARRGATVGAGIGCVGLTVGAVVGHVPVRVGRLWTDFKRPVDLTHHGVHLANTSGEGRFQFWSAAFDSARAHPLTGSGPGTFQLDWLPRAPRNDYVTNAHSLYVETYAELGLIGLALLSLFVGSVLLVCARSVVRSSGAERTVAAAISAAVVAFFVQAAADWFWQVPVLVTIVLLLIGCVLAGSERGGSAETSRGQRFRQRVARGLAVIAGVGAIAAIVLPLLVDRDIRRSQAAVLAASFPSAVHDAADAVALEPGSGEARSQLALALDRSGETRQAVAAAQGAVKAEPQNWATWLTLARTESAAREPRASRAALRRAQTLNTNLAGARALPGDAR